MSQESLISPRNNFGSITLWRYAALLAGAWTALVIISLAANLYQDQQATLEFARIAARNQIDHITLCRHWNALHKGIYVPVNEQTQPNPYLSGVPERDLVTPSGRKLTLVNPAYMTRQLDELGLVTTWLTHGLLWVLGLAGIGWGAVRLDKNLARQRWTETELQEVNTYLGALIEAAPLAIVNLDTQGRVRLWNPAAANLFGWRSSEVLGQPPPFITADLEPETQDLYARGLSGEPVSGMAGAHHRTGMALEFSFSMYPLQGPGEVFNGVMTVMEDITERRHTEAELFKANEQLKAWVFEFSRRNKDITLLNEMGDLLQACLTIEEAYKGVGQYLSRMFPDLSGVLFVYKADKNILEAMAHWGEPHPGAKVFSPEECWALRMGQEHLVQDPAAGLLCGHLKGGSHSYLCVPMVAHGETLGLLSLHLNPKDGSSAATETLSESKKRLAITAAKQIALSLANLNLRHSLQEQAIRDPLTGLYNRRYLEETLEREIFRVQRKSAPLSIIMLDLDFFKHFNDTFGHEAGDTLLQAVGDFLRSHIRQEDIPCRYGGEEFIIILPEAPLEVTQTRAEELRQGVEKLQVEYQGRPLGPITASFGVADFPNCGHDAETIIRAADSALYRAKKEGRNRVVTASREEI